jgi:hypothetical protein
MTPGTTRGARLSVQTNPMPYLLATLRRSHATSLLQRHWLTAVPNPMTTCRKVSATIRRHQLDLALYIDRRHHMLQLMG